MLDVLVGIEAGVLGGLVMLGCYVLAAPLLGQPWWSVPNLLGSCALHGGSVLSEPGAATWTGAAMQLTGAGVSGAINGLLTPGDRLFGLFVAAGWYLLCYLFLWKRIAPLMLVHASQPLVIAGYLLYGSVLGWHPQLRALSARHP